MRVLIGAWAWINKEDIDALDVQKLRKALTIYPRKVGDHPGDPPPPVYLYEDTPTHLGIPRQYFLQRMQRKHDVTWDVTAGNIDEWGGPLKFHGTLRSEQQQAIDEISRLLEKGSLGGVLKASPGWGKCVNSLAFLPTSQGLKRITELVDRDSGSDLVEERLDLGHAINLQSRDRITHTYIKHDAPTIGIMTSWGTRLECTPEHPLLCMGPDGPEWKEVQRITTDDYVTVGRYELDDTPYSLEDAPRGKLILPDRVTPWLARFMGFLTGDGGLTVKGRTTLTNEDDSTADEFKDIAKRLGCSVNTCPDYPIDHRIHSRDMDRFLEWSGCHKVTAHYKQIPWLVRYSGREALREFVRGYMEVDGTVDKGYARLDATSVSRALLEQLQTVLLAFRVVSSVDIKNGRYKGERCTHWRLRINRQFIAQYEKEIGFLTDRKKMALRREIESLEGKQRNTNSYTLPVNQIIADLLKDLKFHYPKGTYKIKARYVDYVGTSKKPSPETVRKFLTILEPYKDKLTKYDLLKDVLEQNDKGVWWVKIKEIYDAGRQTVYDVTVDESHSYIANGIVSHNTTTMCALMARMRVPTLVLVHKSFLLDQWKKRIAQFLPEASIGHVQQAVCDYRGHHVVMGMMSSLARRQYEDEFYEWPGLLIIDENHHSGSQKWSTIPPKFRAKWRIGVSATPRRKDGATNVITYHIGPIVFEGREKRMTPAIRRVWTRFNIYKTDTFNPALATKGLILRFLCANRQRNTLIVEQLTEAALAGRKIIVLSERLNHLQTLSQMLLSGWDQLENPKPTVSYYVGGMKQEALNDAETAQIIFSTFQMASEGLDIVSLDTAFFATPISDPEQPSGRILRPCEGKKPPVIVDFRDDLVEKCAKWGESRDRWYKKIGAMQ
jgi:superfamily II DNA or RNA helicase/intein/homing endonuclease